MFTFFTCKKDAYKFSDKEKALLLMILEFFKYEIPNGNGSYLAMLELDKIDFYWSPYMSIEDNGIFGSWLLSSPNCIYVKPNQYDTRVKDILMKKKSLSAKEKEWLKIYEEGAISHLPIFKDLELDQDLLKFVIYLVEADGLILSTVFHELYHKWQCSTSKFLYIVNLVVFMLLGYEFSTKNKYSIEGDVRIYVDNETLHKTIGKFYSIFYSWLYLSNRMIAKLEEKESLLEQLEQLKQEDYRNFKFVELLVRSLK